MGERNELFAGQKIGKLLLIRPEGGQKWLCNDVPDALDWIRKNVTEKCRRCADLSVCEAFAVSGEVC